ncbi:hypothetical protein J4225_04230 [Candidatus Pacearchaeota archaeon]|nr:hypothetical protein [Candidatus Pacearchaeota archaeon]
MVKTLVKDFLPTENEELARLLSSEITLHAIIPINSNIYLSQSEMANDNPMDPTEIMMGRERRHTSLRSASEKKRGYNVTYLKVIYSPNQ